MKQVTTFLILVMLLYACGNTNPAGEEWPQDLEAKQALLKEKREALKTLTDDIAKLEKEIIELDPENGEKRSLVTTLKAERKEFKHFVEIQGSVQADDFVSASSEVPGRIIRLAVEEGQEVRAGQLIAKLDLEQVDKQIAELEKSLELARDVYERQKRLWDQNIGSEIQYLQAKNNKERLEKSLETVRFQLTKSEVHAPISGVVERVNLKSGELASPGMPIVQILNTRKVKVSANVPENYLQAVRKGESVTVKFPALGKEQKARVSLIGSTIDPGNRTFNVEVNLSNPKGLLKPNLLAIMLINDLTRPDVVTVPLELVQQEVSGRDFVFVKGEGENGAFAKKVYVTTAESFENEIVIEEGLTGGEELINVGARGLSEHELIEVVEQ